MKTPPNTDLDKQLKQLLIEVRNGAFITPKIAQIKALIEEARIDGRIDELESLPIGIDIETGQYRMRYDFTDYYQDRLIQLKRRKKSLLKKRLEK